MRFGVSYLFRSGWLKNVNKIWKFLSRKKIDTKMLILLKSPIQHYKLVNKSILLYGLRRISASVR